MSPLLDPAAYARRILAALATLVLMALLSLGLAGWTSAGFLARVQSEAASLDGYHIPKLSRHIRVERDGALLLSARLSGPAVLRAQTSGHAELDLRLTLEPERLDLRRLLEARIDKQVAPLARLGRFQSANARFGNDDIAIAADVPVTLSLGLLPGAEQSWPARITASAKPEAKDGRLSLRLRYRSLSFQGSTPPGMLGEARKRARERLNRRLYPRLALPPGWQVLDARIEDGVMVLRVSYRDAARPWFCSPPGLQSPLVCGFLRAMSRFL